MKVFKTIVPTIIVVMLLGLLLWTSCSSEGTEGAHGPQGEQGVGIESTIDNDNGTFTFNYTDGTSFTTSNLTGPQGDTGDTGATGATGPQGSQGDPGPNMIVAMGSYSTISGLTHSYNVDSCTWDPTFQRYNITITDYNIDTRYCVPMVTPKSHSAITASAGSIGNSMVVYLWDSSGNPVQGHFSFMVLEAS